MTATIFSFAQHETQREQEDRLEQAELAASWFFDHATKGPKADFDAKLQVSLGMRGEKWREARKAAMDEFRAATKEARKLFDETVECFLSHGELSEELDAQWTELVVRVAMAQAAE